jgi:hypothetical protein
LTPLVNPRARTREDRAGDPLDGLVNLFDIGIVLAVAFLLAALTSIDLAPSVLKQNSEQAAGSQVPADSVIVKPGQEDNPIQLQQGERVVGQGEPVGTVYKLDDGRTVIVRPEDEAPLPGEAPDDGTTGGSAPAQPGASSGSGVGSSSGSGVGSSTTTTPDPASPSDPPTTPRGDDAPVDNEALTTPQPSTGAP